MPRNTKSGISTPHRLVCVVEGHGEVAAIPNLCTRIAHSLAVYDWIVDENPVKQPRSRLVDEAQPSPNRPPHPSIMSAVELAVRRPADAVLVVCDSDDDCAAHWGPLATSFIEARCAGGAVMAVREFESWLLAAKLQSNEHRGRSLEGIRNAKGELKRLVPGYKPTVHQLELTREIDIQALRGYSSSFDKLVRTLAKIFGEPSSATQFSR